MNNRFDSILTKFLLSKQLSEPPCCKRNISKKKIRVISVNNNIRIARYISKKILQDDKTSIK